jgi:hypothetical protein
MQSNEGEVQPVLLPANLASVFASLRRGRHICRRDGDDFRNLNQHFDGYAQVFRALGYELVRHPHEFFYLQGRQRGFVLNDRLYAVTLFMLILFQHLEDTKFQEKTRAWERTLVHRAFTISELPHFTTSAPRQDLMAQVDVTPENLRQRVLKPLEQWGVIDFEAQDRFRFRSPVYRFVDLCEAYAKEPAWPPPNPEPGMPAQENSEAHGQSEQDKDEDMYEEEGAS